MFHPDSSYYQRLLDRVVGRTRETTTHGGHSPGGRNIPSVVRQVGAGALENAAAVYGRNASASRTKTQNSGSVGCGGSLGNTKSGTKLPRHPRKRPSPTMQEQQREHEQQRARLEVAVGELMDGKITNEELMKIAQETVDSAPSSTLPEAVHCEIETPIPPVRIGHGIYPDPKYTMVDFATLKAHEMEETYCKRAVRHEAMTHYGAGACVEDYFLVLEQLVINGHPSLLKRQLRHYRNADGTPCIPTRVADRHMVYATNRFMSTRVYLLMTVLFNVVETFTTLRKLHDEIREHTEAEADTMVAEHTPMPSFLYSLNGVHILMYCLTMIVSGCVARCTRFRRPTTDSDNEGSKRVLTATLWKASWKQHCFTTSSRGARDECPCPSSMCVVCEREFNLTKRHDKIYGPGTRVPSDDPWPSVVELVYPMTPGGDATGNCVTLAWLPFCSVCATGMSAYSEVFHNVQTGVVRLQQAIADHHELTKTTLSHKSITELLANERFRTSMHGASTSPVAQSIATVRSCYAAFMGAIVPSVLVRSLRRITGDPYGAKQDDVRYETVTEIDDRCLVNNATGANTDSPDGGDAVNRPIGFCTTLPRGVSTTQLVERFEDATLVCFFEPLPEPHGDDSDDEGENTTMVTEYVATRALCMQRGIRRVLAACAATPRTVARPKRPRPRPPREPIEASDDPSSPNTGTESRGECGRKRQKLTDGDKDEGDAMQPVVVSERKEPAPIVVL